MTINTIQIQPNQRDAILDYQEGHFIDLKSIDIAPAKLTKTLSAFANADGGELFVGIDEGKNPRKCLWRGFSNQEAANGYVQAFEDLFPLSSDFQYGFLSCEGSDGLVLYLHVHKTKDIKKASDRKPYVRRGAQSLPFDTPEKLRRLELNKGIVSFENETLDLGLENLSNSAVIIEFLLTVIPTAEPDVWLRKQLLIRENKPTVAGVLLFSEEPQAALPKRCGVKIYRYKTKEKEGSRETLAFNPVTIEGSLYAQIEQTVKQTVEIVEKLTVVVGADFEAIKYPRETLHEILTNAVLHRDYSIADDIHVRIFDNRIEIESPGRLPGHVTPENILHERFARNGQIVRILNKFPNPPNKDVGEGLNTAFEAMRNLQLKEPEVEERDNSVVVNIRHERLASPETLIMEYLDESGQITNSIARELCHIGSENRVKRIFEKLQGMNKIERIPGLRGNKTAYRKKS